MWGNNNNNSNRSSTEAYNRLFVMIFLVSVLLPPAPVCVPSSTTTATATVSAAIHFKCGIYSGAERQKACCETAAIKEVTASTGTLSVNMTKLTSPSGEL